MYRQLESATFCNSLAKTSIASPTPAPGSALELVLIKMPQKLKVESADDLVTFLSEGFGDQISLCQPISEKAEAQLLGMIAR